MANLIGILQSDNFVWGVVFGGGFLILFQLLAPRWPNRLPLPIGGTLVGLGAVLVVFALGEIDVVALVGLLVSGGLTLVVAGRAPSYVTALVSVPGAILVSFAAPSDPTWVRPLIIVLVPLVGWLSSDFDARYERHGLGLVFACLATAGTFLAVPDTEWARALFAVAFPVAFLAWPRVLASLGSSGAYLFATSFVVVTVVGGIGRPASIIGAMAGLGLLLVEPLGVRSRPGLLGLARSLNRAADTEIIASLPQVVIVLLTSRIAARTDDPLYASIVSLGVLGGAYLLLVWVEKRRAMNSATTPSDA